MKPFSATVSTASPNSHEAQAQVVEGLPRPLDRSRVPAFLETYGYIARDSLEWWDAPLPELTLQVRGHEKVGKHSYYAVDCSLSRPGQWQSPYLTWRSSLRLTHLRAGLHDRVKQELGDSYKKCFDGVHFAHRYALNGTTARLDAWCRKLANSITAKQATPAVAAFTLQLLGVPDSAAMDASRSPDQSPGKDVREGDAASQASLAHPAQSPDFAGEAALDALNPFSEDLFGGEGADEEEEEEAAYPHFSGSDVFGEEEDRVGTRARA
mmetsp:Transcript_66680/g.208631  ORF Transcript_66680/g.208631 Transcript_66680/m.208631 type:complete len:267 (-) Transcript_66680:120-920(-)